MNKDFLVSHPIRELSLFSGVGGGILGSILLNHKIIGGVEFDEYCCKILEQQQLAGNFSEFPIFQTDIRKFISEGYASLYQGQCDLVSAGFPCQPFSVAGKRKAGDDTRNMWPATLDVINIVQPPIVYLENVPGLLSASMLYCSHCGDFNWQNSETKNGNAVICGTCQISMDHCTERPFYYFGTVLRDLAESGYDAKWCVLGADDVGANHHRKRLWILAYAHGFRGLSMPGTISNPNEKLHQRHKVSEPYHAGKSSGVLADTEHDGCTALPQLRGDETASDNWRQKKQNGSGQPSGVGQSGNAQGLPGRKGRSRSNLANTKQKRSQGSKPEWRQIPECERLVNSRVTVNVTDTDQSRPQRRQDRQSPEWCDTKGYPWPSREHGWWHTEPGLGRVANGVANRSHRLKGTGNGQVPLCYAAAFLMLARSYAKSLELM